ncbi:MAG: AbrB/MazE/SpoVT family DNA-binding domain-containing protein [Faecalibacterium sp.]|nr:AbrB/MazE/SpoVT family DNA-binding domain-containing protein [Faecalibacterium sp.]
MKATGIVRRIDDLGRVVIPKEIRRTQRIRQGDPLEIFTTPEGEVIFKKYSPIGELGEEATQYAEVLYKSFALPAIVCDRDHVIAAAGAGKKDVMDRRISLPLEKLMDSRKSYEYPGAADRAVYPCEGSARHLLTAAPIVAAGDVVGAVALLCDDAAERPTEAQIKAILVAALYLARQMEQ